ncbi:hypothetical protein [Ancylobacter terrae]|uniref:hypothetical protein n=1 Tax=Ancylobacter sp. sgz301288 TaxID=3342077 RepID=UPI0038584A15
MNEASPPPRVSILRLRTGFLVLLALGIVSAMAGRWIATLFHLGAGWAALLGLAVSLLAGALLAGLGTRSYVAVAVLVTLLAMYTAYDFARGPVDWSQGWAAAFALLPALLLGAAFWDFRRLVGELRRWAQLDLS